MGGTLLTITGNHFSTVITDNPVKIGKKYCYVVTTADTEITCRMADLTTQAEGAELLLVFARTTEEMICDLTDDNDPDETDCSFTFEQPTATVTGISSNFDAATNSIHVTISGTDLASSTSEVQLEIDGFSQTAVSAGSTSVVFQVTGLLDESSFQVLFYNIEGTVTGASSIKEHTFTPGLVSVSPSTGSSGGSKLTVTGVGFGTNSASVNLYHVESNQNICDSRSSVNAYGDYTCYTIAQEIQSTDTLRLSVGGQTYDCLNSGTPSDCKFEALDASSPTVTAITVIDDTTLEFSVTLLIASDSIDCNMLGVTGSGVSSNGSTTVTCTFDKGVPGTDNPVTPALVFITTSGDLEDTALPGDATVTNPIGTPSGEKSKICSF